MSVVSALPVELWHHILRFTYEISLSSDILLQDYPWVDTLRSRNCRAYASARRGAMARSIGQVCRSWEMFSKQLGYQEVALGSFGFSFYELLMERESYPNVFSETRRLTVKTLWSDNAQELCSLVQSMPRLEWLQLSTHEIEGSYLRTWLPRILGAQPCLLYLDLEPLHRTENVFIDSESVSVISGLAICLQRLTCAIDYVDHSDGQVRHAPRFHNLQVLQVLDIRCDPEHEQAAGEWFSQWHVPSLKQFYIPQTWEYFTELLNRGLGAQLEVLDASAHGSSRLSPLTQLWLLCPRVHTLITSRTATLPPEARPRLHHIFAHPFRRWATGFDAIVLASLLEFLWSEREERGTGHREYTFSLQYTELSWQSWAEACPVSLHSRVRPTLLQWKSFAEEGQMEVLDGYGIDIKDVTIPSEGPE